MNHSPETFTDLALIEPGEPQRSLLYHRISRCEPVDKGGSAVANMPRNAPTLLDPGLVAMVRDWIEAGAPDN